MSNFVEVCPEIPVNGVCPVPLVWIEHVGGALAISGFLEMMPFLLTTAFSVWGFRKLIYVFKPSLARS